MSGKGLSFDELYPGTYIKAGEFKGKAATLTIKTVTRKLISDGSGTEEPAVIVAFEELEKLWVMNKTCAVCLRAMWGDDSGEWVGHAVTLHPVDDTSGLSESGKCIRVKGSPELDGELKFRAHVGRVMLTQTLVKTKGRKATDPAPDLAGTGEAVNAETGEVTPAGEALPEVAAEADDGELI